MRYKIIKDIDKLNDFINMLPNLEFGETYFIRLLTRSKYVNEVSDDQDLKFLTVPKDKIIQSLKQLETKIGTYDNLKENEICAYLSPNPRSQKEVIKKTLQYFSKVVGNYNGQDPMVLISEFYKRSYSRHIYYDIDFDKCDVGFTLSQTKKFINNDCVKVLHTKNGLHLIIKISDIDIKKYPNWLQNIQTLPNYDSNCSSDNNIPIPGCSQFGFIPYFTDL
jgi:hypothetical protein